MDFTFEWENHKFLDVFRHGPSVGTNCRQHHYGIRRCVECGDGECET
jgi:hypothetical protein